MNELLSVLKPAWIRNENSPDVSPEFAAGALQTSMKPVTRTFVYVTRVSAAIELPPFTVNDVVDVGTEVVAPLKFVVTEMPLIENHGADASVTVVWNVPSAPGVPATWIGDEQAPEATVMLCWLASTAAGMLKPNNVPAAMSEPVVLQTSMYPSVPGSTGS